MMIIPGINCETLSCFEEALQKLKTLSNEWMHIDVSDGEFAPTRTFNDVEKLGELFKKTRFSKKIEAHLMVKFPEGYVSKWLSLGVKRIILHAEVMRDKKALEEYKEKCEKSGAEFGLALNPNTNIEDTRVFIGSVSFVQILAVRPGLSGQKELDVSDKIRLLRRQFPRVTIEVDGGVNDKTAPVLKKAGADAVVSTSYILKGENPLERYRTLVNA